MIVDYQAIFSIKTSEGAEPPSMDTVRSMLVLALMRSEVWLIQELDSGDLEISLNRVQIHDWNTR
jgi:hypothetical protein